MPTFLQSTMPEAHVQYFRLLKSLAEKNGLQIVFQDENGNHKPNGTIVEEGLQVVPTPDPLDVAAGLNDRIIAIYRVNQKHSLYVQVMRALDRMKEGLYDECMACEKEIPHIRHMASPEATLCVGCQDMLDKGALEGFSSKLEEEIVADN